ncbi:hypothetical protein ACEWY4_012281 [Coilia grayii]|uniref:THD domain-containing protein n=1 Tax=Coilia grayii TaxID=363190 RepID=A0ABD1K046_9TELE
MDGPFSDEDLSDRAYQSLAPTSREINRKICVSIIAAVVFNTVVSACLVMYGFSTQAKASPAHTLPELSRMQQVGVGPKANNPSSLKSPHAHLTVADPFAADGIISWNLDSFYNMTYNSSNRSLLIPKSGLYSIYLQVIYYNKNLATDKTCERQRFLVHEVTRKSKRYQFVTVPIITAKETVSCKEDKEEHWSRTIHSTTRLSLDKGDELQVKIQHPASKFVDMAGKPYTKTFWGVYQCKDMN